MAHGSKVGYVKDGETTFIDETTTVEQAKTPSIISLGRLIQYGAKMQWSKEGAFLTSPSGRRLKVPVVHNCPYADEEIVKAVNDQKEEAKQKKRTRDYMVNLYKPFFSSESGRKKS